MVIEPLLDTLEWVIVEPRMHAGLNLITVSWAGVLSWIKSNELKPLTPALWITGAREMRERIGLWSA